LFSKCEFNNPTGSHKDRTFLHILNILEEENKIIPGMTLIDCSTGNGGAALAWIGQKKGYKIKIFMPEGMTEERKEQIYSFGGEIIETPKENFLKGAVKAATEYSNHQKNIFFLNQSDTTLNKDAWHSCGEEIVRKMKEINKKPDYFICSIGTGGTFSGIAEILKKAYPRIHTVGIEVDQSAPIYSQRHGLNFHHKHHNLMGLGAGVISVNTLLDLIDEVRVVNGKAAWERMKSFIEKERLGIGPTCGANLLITEDIMQEVNGKVIVTLFFDSAWKYKSCWDGVYPGYKETQ
ncbi:cysteine synthase family protein, partial [Yersinia pestis]